MTGSNIDRRFKISGNKLFSTDQITPENGAIIVSRRKLRCLDGFLGGNAVWVFHSELLDPDNVESMYLSTLPEDFEKIWGPMWRITNTGQPQEVLRFELENGTIVSTSNQLKMDVNEDEELCHWMSNHDFRQWEMGQVSNENSLISKPRLLIGASSFSIHKNQESCLCSSAQVTQEFRRAGYLHESGTSISQRQTDSISVGAGFGGGGIGAPLLNVGVTTKIVAGRTLKEQVCKRWTNEPLRNWHVLLRYFGVEISFCTDNSRRRRLIDLLASMTMRNLMEAVHPFSDDSCRKEVEEILMNNPLQLLELPKTRPRWRGIIEKAIGRCLSALFDSGTTHGIKAPLRAFWMYENQEWIVQFPYHSHEWTGFVLDYDKSCAFVILEEDCLVLKHWRGCQHPPKTDQKAQRVNLPSVFETALIPNDKKELPEGMELSEKMPPNDKRFWNVSQLKGSKYQFRMGERGKLTICKPWGSRVLIGRWQPLPLFETGKRKLASTFREDSPKYHFERLYDDFGAEVVPIKFLVMSK